MEIKRENIGWIDLLRVIACFLVVFSHCCDAFIADFSNRASFLTGVFSGSLVRASVPLFVMMTGVLLLPIRTDVGAFYKKRIGRLAMPAIFWCLALPVLFFIYLNYFNPGTGNPLISIPGHSLNELWVKLYTFPFNFNFDTVPLWYVYMLIGLYFIIPVVSGWLQNASQKDLKIFLSVWGVSLFVPYIKMAAPLLGLQGYFGNMSIFGVCDWNEFGTFYYVSGFIGYLVLAYYLVKFPLSWSWSKMLGITVPMFIAGYLVTSFGFIATQNRFPGNYAYLEIVWNFSNINVFMMTFPVFVIVQKMKVPSLPWLSRLASYTFGIYLCHYIFNTIVYDILDVNLPYFIRIASMACLSFATSWLLVWLMSKSPVTKRFVQ